MKSKKNKISSSIRADQKRITVWLDKQVVDILHQEASQNQMKYQTWLNQFLRKTFVK